MAEINMIELIENSPDDISDFNVNTEKLKKDLIHEEYAKLLDEDNSIDIYEVLDRYGLKYVENESWVSMSGGGIKSIEINAHDILNSLFNFPDQYEGMDSFTLDKYLILLASVAEGQGGGLAIIDMSDGKWIFKTSEFSVQQIVWIPTYGIFACLHDVSSYTWHAISLELIDLNGKHYSLQLFKSSMSDGNSDNLKYFVDSNPILEYDKKNDTLKYCEWRQGVEEILTAVGFSGK